MPHRVFAEARGLLHVQTPYENSSCGNDTKAERKTPDRIEVVIAEAMMAKPVKKTATTTQNSLTSKRVPEGRMRK